MKTTLWEKLVYKWHYTAKLEQIGLMKNEKKSSQNLKIKNFSGR